MCKGSQQKVIVDSSLKQQLIEMNKINLTDSIEKYYFLDYGSMKLRYDNGEKAEGSLVDYSILVSGLNKDSNNIYYVFALSPIEIGLDTTFLYFKEFHTPPFMVFDTMGNFMFYSFTSDYPARSRIERGYLDE